jgi:hypothetical protein
MFRMLFECTDAMDAQRPPDESEDVHRRAPLGSALIRELRTPNQSGIVELHHVNSAIKGERMGRTEMLVPVDKTFAKGDWRGWMLVRHTTTCVK